MQLWIMGTYKFGLYLTLFCKMQPCPSVVVWLANLKVNKETIFDTCWHLRHSSVLSLTHVCNAIFHCNVIFISKGHALLNENDFINWTTTYECNQIKDIDTFANENKNNRLLAAFIVPRDTFWNNVLGNQGLGDRGSQPQISQDDGD